MSTGKIIDGYCCCYNALTCDDCVFGCTNSEEVLCCVEDSCLSLNCKENLGCGCVTNKENNECCKIGCICLRFGLKTPDTCCAAASQCFCLKSVGAFPMNERYIPKPVCGFLFLTCSPEFGCCVDAPECKALNEDPLKKSMVRD